MSEEYRLATIDVTFRQIVVRVTIPGEPHSWDRVDGRFVRYDTPANKAWKQTVRQYLALANPRLLRDPVDSESRFGFVFLFATNGRRKKDVDNLQKIVLDASQGIIFLDDNQVDEAYSRVVRGDIEPRSELTFYRIGDRQ